MKKMKLAVCFSILSFLMASMAYAGSMTTVAGNGSYGYCGDGGPATEACLATPFDVTFDDAGNYYIADHSNDRIRKVDTRGIITTVAGGGSSLASGVNALDASIRRASALAFLSLGGRGYLYISDRDNWRACVLDIDGGKVYNILTDVPGGSGGIRPVVINDVLYVYVSAGDGRLMAVTMSDPITPGMVTDIRTTSGIAHMISYVRGSKTILVMNEYWAGLVSQMDISDPLAPTGYTVIAGGGSDRGDTVPAVSAFLIEPYGLVRDRAGNLYVSEHAFHTRSSGNRVRKITPDGSMSTVAGVSGVYGFMGDGGPATAATFHCPTGLTLDPGGNLYIGDDWNHRIRMVALGTCLPPPAGMVGWWPGDGKANDAAGTNHGTVSMGAAFETGLVGQTFSLDGSSGYVRVADHASLDTPDGFTVDAWIYPRSFGGAKVIASKWDDPTGQWSWIFKLHNDGSGRLRIEISRGDHNALGDLGGATILPLNTWSHVAATYDRQTSRLRLYVNGNVDTEGSARFPGVAVNNSATDLLIGAVNGQTASPGEYFHGLIDEVELYSRALSNDELRSIYLAGSAGKCKPKNRQPVANAGPDRTVLYDIAAQGASVTLDGSASSDPDGDRLTYTWTWDGGSATGATPTILLPAGATIVTLAVNDGNSETAADSVQISVVYSFGGFLQPVGRAKAFKRGRTIPVKFQLTDAHGLFVPSASAHISLVPISHNDNEPVGDVVEGTSNVPGAGNTFRYDPRDNQYIYTLSTRPLNTGIWRIIVSLNDGRSYTADMSIK